MNLKVFNGLPDPSKCKSHRRGDFRTIPWKSFRHRWLRFHRRWARFRRHKRTRFRKAVCQICFRLGLRFCCVLQSQVRFCRNLSKPAEALLWQSVK